MRDALLSFCALIVFLISFTNVTGVKLVPNGKTITHKDGATHEVSKYLVVPDSVEEQEDNKKSASYSASYQKTQLGVNSYDTRNGIVSEEHTGDIIDNDEAESTKSEYDQRLGLGLFITTNKKQPTNVNYQTTFINGLHDYPVDRTKVVYIKMNNLENPFYSPSRVLFSGLQRNAGQVTDTNYENELVNEKTANVAQNQGKNLRVSNEYLNGVFGSDEAGSTTKLPSYDSNDLDFEFYRSHAKDLDLNNGFGNTLNPQIFPKNYKSEAVSDRYSSEYMDYWKLDSDDPNKLNDPLNKANDDYEEYNMEPPYDDEYKQRLGIIPGLSLNNPFATKQCFVKVPVDGSQFVPYDCVHTKNDMRYVIDNRNDIYNGNLMFQNVAYRYPQIKVTDQINKIYNYNINSQYDDYLHILQQNIDIPSLLNGRSVLKIILDNDEKYSINKIKLHYNNNPVITKNIVKVETKYKLINLKDFLTKYVVVPKVDTAPNVESLYNNILYYVIYLENSGVPENHVYRWLDFIKRRVLYTVKVITLHSNQDTPTIISNGYDNKYDNYWQILQQYHNNHKIPTIISNGYNNNYDIKGQYDDYLKILQQSQNNRGTSSYVIKMQSNS